MRRLSGMQVVWMGQAQRVEQACVALVVRTKAVNEPASTTFPLGKMTGCCMIAQVIGSKNSSGISWDGSLVKDDGAPGECAATLKGWFLCGNLRFDCSCGSPSLGA